MSNSLPDIDLSLEWAENRVADLGGRLFELDAERQRRAGEVDGLRGATATAWQHAQDQISVMWSWYRVLSEAVGSIATRRRSPGIDRREIDALSSALETPSVVLPAESVELARRCLPGERVLALTWAIQPLAELMSTILKNAAEIMASVFVIRDMGLSKLDEMSTSLAGSVGAAGAAGGRVPNEARSVQDRLIALRDAVATDPLAVAPDDIGQLSATVTRLGQEIDEAVARLSTVDAALERIQADLQAGLDSLAGGHHDLLEAQTKIAGWPDLPSAAEGDRLAARLAELGAGLDEARTRAATGDRAAAVRLVAALGPGSAIARDAAAALAGSAAAPLVRRRELRGRLDAYRAKAHTMGRAEDPALMALYRRAEEILFTAPCDLDEGQRRLAAYQEGILQRPGREAPR